MRQLTFTGLTTLLLGALVACAGPAVDSAGSGGFAPTSDLTGTWHVSFVQLGGSLYTNDGKGVVEIKEDGTFTANITARAWCGQPREGVDLDGHGGQEGKPGRLPEFAGAVADPCSSR